jgi:Amino acid synthesis
VDYDVRKWVGTVEEIEHEGGPRNGAPLRKAVCAAVLRNPLAGGFTEDLTPLVAPSAELGAELGRRAADLLGAPAEGYGKGAIAGAAGEQEHAVACITTPFGDALREAIGGGVAWIPSATKTAPPGETLDIPLAFKDALYVRSHYDAVALRVPDGPRADEIVVAVALSSGGRVHARLGGLHRDEAQGDGLR